MPDLDGHYFYGHAILPSKVDRDTVTIGGSGYSNPGVYRSTDAGNNWSNWSQGLPATMIYSLGEPNDDSGWVFAGTETAAYMQELPPEPEEAASTSLLVPPQWMFAHFPYGDF